MGLTKVFVDANIPIYAAGKPPQLKEPSSKVLSLIARGSPETFLTDAEVFQELLHRYRAGGIWDLGREVLESFGVVMEGRVEAVYLGDIRQAISLADQYSAPRSRDLVHAAVMERVESQAIVSADRHFDEISGIRRLDPAEVEWWEGELG